MNSAKIVITAFGGSEKLSKLTGINASTIRMWCTPKPAGCGGMVPHKHKMTLAKLALDHGLDINKEINKE